MVKSLLFGLTVGSVGTLVAMQYHLVRTDERFVIVSRTHQPPLRSAYVDIRHWSPAMWEHYPELQEAIVKAGRQDLLTARVQPASTALDSAVPFQGVSRTGDTPIFTASDARQAPTPPPVQKALPPEASNLLASPRVALGTPVTTMNLPSVQPVPQPATTIIQNIPALSHSTLSNLPEAAESMLQSMQRTVPAPEEIAASTAVTRSPGAAPGAVIEQLKEGSKPDWMQSLLRTIVPGTAPVPGASSPAPITTAPSPQASSRTAIADPFFREESAVEQIPPVSASPFRTVPQTEDRSFPATPRRIDSASGQEI